MPAEPRVKASSFRENVSEKAHSRGTDPAGQEDLKAHQDQPQQQIGSRQEHRSVKDGVSGLQSPHLPLYYMGRRRQDSRKSGKKSSGKLFRRSQRLYQKGRLPGGGT